MSLAYSYKILGLQPGAGEPEIKKAYRRLAKIYHPDKNKSPEAARKFSEITSAYNELIKGQPIPYKRDESYTNAAEIIRMQHERAREKARKAEEKRKKAEEKFQKSELFDLLLFLKYFSHGFILLFSFASILGPILLGIFVEPVAFFASIYFVIIGAFLLWHIYSRRKTWFKLGKFNTNLSTLRSLFKKPISRPTVDKCFYIKGETADGKPYRINLVRVTHIHVKSFGAMNHNANMTSRTKSMIIPRSAKAEFIHRICSIIKILAILISLICFPVSSFFWRLIAGIILSGIFSLFILRISGVKGKTSYLFTPALIFKIAVWLMAVLAISSIGPGFEIAINEYKYLLFAGLFFLLDMIFDLMWGFFPFYNKLFKPIFKQGRKLSGLYLEGYQNYIEYPFYSIFFPLLKWIF